VVPLPLCSVSADAAMLSGHTRRKYFRRHGVTVTTPPVCRQRHRRVSRTQSVAAAAVDVRQHAVVQIAHMRGMLRVWCRRRGARAVRYAPDTRCRVIRHASDIFDYAYGCHHPRHTRCCLFSPPRHAAAMRLMRQLPPLLITTRHAAMMPFSSADILSPAFAAYYAFIFMMAMPLCHISTDIRYKEQRMLLLMPR